jgi:hypothetical protein
LLPEKKNALALKVSGTKYQGNSLIVGKKVGVGLVEAKLRPAVLRIKT